jgi:hypothetical protein
LIYDFTGSAAKKISFGDPVQAVKKYVTPGLYYNPHKDFFQNVVTAWPVEKRTYSIELWQSITASWLASLLGLE